MRSLLILFSLIICTVSFGQFKPENGIKPSTPKYYAIKNATVIVSPTKKLLKATILIKDEKIIKVGPFVSIPNSAVEIDMKGGTIVPAFVELNTSVGIPEAKRKPKPIGPQIESTKSNAFYWNEAIHPELNASSIYERNEKSENALLKKGFGFAVAHQQDGIIRGEGAIVALGTSKKNIFNSAAGCSFFSFDKGVSNMTYPSSQMGAIALIRQTFYDLKWYTQSQEKYNASLNALDKQLKGNLFFSTKEKREILRASKIGKEFDLSFNYIGSGNEYQIAKDLTQLNSRIIIPINFPKAYDVDNPYIVRQIPLSNLKHWELAPRNPAILRQYNIPICISSSGTKTDDVFWDNLRRAIEHGLSEEEAIEALTMGPAKACGMEKLIGTIEKGKLASFFIYDGNPFRTKSKLLESWHLGEQKIYASVPKHNVLGKYSLQLDGNTYTLKIEENGKDKLKGTVTQKIVTAKGERKEVDAKAKVLLNNHDITIQFIADNNDLKGNISLQGKVNSKFGVFEGDGLLPDGNWIKWSAIKKGLKFPDKEKNTILAADTTMKIWYPNMAYGYEKLPSVESIVIKNATVWTNEEEGILENANIVIKDGKITYVGTGNGSRPANAKVIDAKGKHVTSGIIDEHSHIAIWKGVNEGGQATSAEVSIGDVVYPDDIDIYLQLAGGVTASQLLHGSANPIGGQSALVKLKWGHSADEMLIENAPKFIKFALGENVKQTNWGDAFNKRFPQTRMGVEQHFYDAFYRAKEYSEQWKSYKLNSSLDQPRRDLELDVLSEILAKDRFITCHSYVQSEINMLMHVADSMGFTLNTFTHILEGYKVADKMALHGAGGSTFSDWWAYKYEVNDAIPYNAKLMTDQGVVVAINSDDAEMGRRLNQEAAKAVKYGGMSEEDAWKMVTLNPAKLLHLDDRMGSLKVGKDADIVIWSDNPLSIMAKAEKTIVDGKILFDIETDLELRKRNMEEKARIITKMQKHKENGGKSQPFVESTKGHFHCDTLGEENTHSENKH